MTVERAIQVACLMLWTSQGRLDCAAVVGLGITEVGTCNCNFSLTISLLECSYGSEDDKP